MSKSEFKRKAIQRRARKPEEQLELPLVTPRKKKTIQDIADEHKSSLDRLSRR